MDKIYQKCFKAGMLVILWLCSLNSEYIPLNGNLFPENPKFTVLSSNLSQFSFELEIPGFFVEDTVIEGETYQIIELLSSQGSTEEVGKPNLPIINRLVGILPQSGISATFQILEDTVLDNYLIFPTQPPVVESLPPLPFTKDEIFYTKDTLYPPNRVVTGAPGILKDFRVQLL